ncbi:MAG TPA: hypothetical protein VLX85_07160 [Stellaceae bacterium]|nr:hypothetical protein [Stellaceae bacterium]
MQSPHRFLFDQSFDQPDAPRAGRKPPPPPEPTFSKAEFEAAKAQALAEGRAAASAEAAQSLEARIAASLQSIEAALRQSLDARAANAEEAQHHALETVRQLMRKLAPALCRVAPLLELEGVIVACLREAFDEPRIVLRVGDTVFDALHQHLSAITSAVGFAGKVVLLADEALGPADARVEWAEGGAERDTDRLIHDIDAALLRALDAIAAPGASPTEENAHE